MNSGEASVMWEERNLYVNIRNALSEEDLGFLRNACKEHLNLHAMPCYVLLNLLNSPTYLKIKSAVEKEVGEPLYYLNDFYLYTDDSFKTSWHMDTELFTFDRAVNGWILLSPEAVESPLAFIRDINESDIDFHSVNIVERDCTFGNYHNGTEMVRSLEAIEAQKVCTPRVAVGDILLLNPKYFHKTNVDIPKHAISVKFVVNGERGLLSSQQVDPYLWPEVATFNQLVKGSKSWNEVVTGISRILLTEEGRKELSAGFYPDRFELYRRMVAFL
jgi:hypothetical protein